MSLMALLRNLSIRGISLLTFAILASSQANAVTVTVNAGLGQPNLILPNGDPVGDGNVIRVGYLDPGFDIVGDGDNPSFVDGAWTPFGEITVMTIMGEPGRVGGSVSKTDVFFDNRQASVWVIQTTGNVAPALDYSNVENHVLLTSSQLNWTFPVEGSATTSTLLSFSEIDTVHNGAVTGAGPGSFQLASSVPEPASVLLVALGCLLIMFSRQRVVPC